MLKNLFRCKTYHVSKPQENTNATLPKYQFIRWIIPLWFLSASCLTPIYTVPFFAAISRVKSLFIFLLYTNLIVYIFSMDLIVCFIKGQDRSSSQHEGRFQVLHQAGALMEQFLRGGIPYKALVFIIQAHKRRFWLSGNIPMSLTEQLLLGNVPLRHMLYEENLLMS